MLNPYTKNIKFFQTLIDDKKVDSVSIEKIIYRLHHNLSLDYDYFKHMLNLSKKASLQCVALTALLKHKASLSKAMPQIRCPRDFVLNLIKLCQNISEEAFFIGLMTSQNCLIELKQLSGGKVDRISIDFRELLKHVLCENASAVILGHNHPSGNVEPSLQDIKFTKKVKHLFACLDIALLDHIIIGRKSYYSFKNKRIEYLC